MRTSLCEEIDRFSLFFFEKRKQIDVFTALEKLNIHKPNESNNIN